MKKYIKKLMKKLNINTLIILKNNAKTLKYKLHTKYKYMKGKYNNYNEY